MVMMQKNVKKPSALDIFLSFFSPLLLSSAMLCLLTTKLSTKQSHSIAEIKKQRQWSKHSNTGLNLT